MILYHMTHAHHLPSILTEGLIPGRKAGFCGWSRRNKKTIYLTDSPRYIIKHQSPPWWCKKNNIHVLSINTIDLNIQRSWKWYHGHEFVYEDGIIPADNIVGFIHYTYWINGDRLIYT